MSDTPAPARPRHVLVYGNDHSPWVQAVLLGLREKGIDHTLVLSPPLSVFRHSGVLMPAAKIDDGPWLLDSARILGEIGFSEVRPDDRSAMSAVFGSGALRRADDPWAFWHRFSFVRDGDPSLPRRLWHQLCRAFSIFYFFTLISFGRRRVPRATHDQLVEELAFWQERLAPDAAFLGGDAPDTTDLQLFGVVQMFASIPGPSLAALRESPKLDRLRAWAGAMHERFAGYARLYATASLEPTRPESAGAAERIGYWTGAALMWVALPVTVPLVFWLVRSIRKKGLVG